MKAEKKKKSKVEDEEEDEDEDWAVDTSAEAVKARRAEAMQNSIVDTLQERLQASYGGWGGGDDGAGR